MSKVGVAPGLSGGPARAIRQLGLLIRRVGKRLFQAEDARARHYGWQIATHHAGLARTYRDPRFDRLRRCPTCGGTGTGPDEQSCGPCSGTGRVTLAEGSLTDPGQD